MAAKAHRSFSKLMSVNSRFLSRKSEGQNVAVKVPMQNNVASKDRVVAFYGRAASQARSHQIQSAASSPQLPVPQKEENQVPDFTHLYEDRGLNPLIAEFNEKAHDWLVTHDVHTQMGPEGWKEFKSGRTPYLVGEVYHDVDRKDFLWCAKFIAWISCLDDFCDKLEIWSDMNKTIGLILETQKVILWFCSEDPRLLRNLEMVFDCIPTDQRDDVFSAFADSLAYARTSSRAGLMSLDLQPLASALRELLIEYCERLPYDCNVRMAQYIQNYALTIVTETKSRLSAEYHTSVAEFTDFRTRSIGVQPLIGLTDLFIDSRRWPQIPKDVFVDTNVQALVDASCRAVAWDNDMSSFSKEVQERGDRFNVIFIIMEECGCSQIEAMNRAKEMFQNEINEFETRVANLKVEPQYQNAVAEYVRICRLIILGIPRWHRKSQRYQKEDHYLR
ncbi:protein MpMTPSL2 [Marchantia polymorpha subsp. ruderalis]|uniref:Terpene synthase n=3 Tax=Marchantia polymorpha TaxID=3197 RepID=A0AAF6B280_MARPO|nr:hypothetical protein MARPO_0142s0043 [Marchantia polymorpha]BBN06114.1 hypothetical protein Mp_3g18500 [Marchantia polymorpha subsp. ruderalis]|eukprot:PTQ29416.1 hypothetical protein MARPO_0142s0043 [Marchantia polymorpha]